MNYVGISEYFHDAAIGIISEDGNIKFASHAERYTKRKNENLCPDEFFSWIAKDDITSFYEELEYKNIKWNHLLARETPINIAFDYEHYVKHHVSHAALAYYTRPWTSKDDTVILTIDGVGEFQTIGIYDSNFNLLEAEYLPKSIGSFYSAATKFLGLQPLEDEYIVMGLSAYGTPSLSEKLLNVYNNFFDDIQESDKTYKNQKYALHDIKDSLYPIFKDHSDEDIAASIQKFSEVKIVEYAKRARKYGSKLCYSGGVAQNVVANSLIKPLFDEMWIAIAPTDAGSSLGCAAYTYGKLTGNDRINWKDAYLGYNIEREINPKEVVDHLLAHTYCGVANGRAEFGPRALGNRSLIADVRYDVKDTVNAIKRRQEYRPFGPAILEEFADEYFEGPMNEYMQYAGIAKHDYKSVTHVDGSARVQIVKKDCTSVFRKIIEEYYERTGVPMLLNTSLNIKGMPMVNDENDVNLFEAKYNVKVF